ncbi:polysaccharide biosynthesis C-terminal domain-containing protein [Virgibacillus salarius]
MVLVIPAVVGLSLLSDEAYGTLFGELDKLAISGPLLAWYAPVALFFALFSVTSSVLQAINQQRFAVVSLLAGLLVKVLFNIQLIYVFGAKGAIFGTALAAGIAVSLNLWRIRSSIDFSYKQLIKRTILIGIFAIIMSVCILILKALLGMVIPNGRWGLAIILTICVIVGGSVYLWFAYHSTLLERVLGKRVRVLDKLFRR